MKTYILNISKLLFIACAFILMYACKGMYDNIEQYANEVVYPAKYDTIISKIGFERVELDLMKAGRIPSDQIKMGKSTKTVVEYDNKQIIVDSLVSWVNVEDLTQSKLYRIKVYTIDDYGNKSVAQEIAVIPFTTNDIQNLVIASPRILTSPSSAVLDWTTSLSSILLDYKSLEFEFTDKDGTTFKGTREDNPRIFAANLNAGEPSEIKLKFNVTPKINNQPILDSVELTETITINMPTGSTPFNPIERDILLANGVTTFTSDGVASFKKLTFPLHSNTLQDLFYFSSVEELDLTGGDIFEMKTLTYDRNGVTSTVGGGDFPLFVKHVSSISSTNAQTMIDLLDLGILKKIKYIPNSLGIDDLLRPYDSQGVIEWVTMPDEVLIPMKFFVDGRVQDANNWKLDYAIPANPFPPGTDIVNPIKITLTAKNGSFALILPTEYRFNTDEYEYLKFKVYMPSKSQLSGVYEAYQRLWPRFMNYIWAFPSESSFGQELWNPNANDYKIPDNELEKWYDVTVPLNTIQGRHNRVIVMNIGGEPSLTFAPSSDMVYYFSNFRFAK